MSCVGFKPTIPTSERAKTVHALDRSATVTGMLSLGAYLYLNVTYNCEDRLVIKMYSPKRKCEVNR
jgi:hypothetical protein